MDRRKVLLLFAVAWLSAAGLTWFLYAATKAPRVEKTVAIVAAAHDLAAGTRLLPGDLKIVRVPQNDVPKMAILDRKQALEHPLLFPMSANEPLTTAKIAGAGAEGLPAMIEIGKRAISVPITDTSGVSGLIQPRAHVDVLFTRPGPVAEAATATILEDVVVLAIGRTTETTSASTSPASAAQAATRPAAQSATLLVTPEQSRTLELAKNQGKISLALRNPLDHTLADDDRATTAEDLYIGMPVPKAAQAPKPQVVVERITERKEAPKPKRVIDVFRGDKHVQETF
ncbi:MAG: Flp pilus assembly protein CpaB [Acidobacteriia bacterium]|nr:Flp pilus assembly protein CpaB [Terriglobia bacterium]